MAKIVIDTDILVSEELTIMEYLNLLYYYSVEKGINLEFISRFAGSVSFPLLAGSLLTKGYVFVSSSNSGEMNVQLRDKTRSLFEGDKDLFLEWFNKFPMKTPSGRVLRPEGDETIRGKKLRRTWNRHFKNRADAARKAIRVLEAELAYRRKTNSFNYMQMAETWLNQGSYEVYEHLLQEYDSSIKREKEDML